MLPIRHKTSLLAVLVAMLVLATIAWRTHADPAGRIITSDVEGYYGYLRALFITHDLGHEPMRVEYVQVTPQGTLNKYFAGVAVLLLPFFLAAHAWVLATGGLADGYTPPYEYAIVVAALCYALVGLLALRAVLLRLGIRDPFVALLVLVLALGTQLAQYTVIQPGWSHVYSFALFALFLRSTQLIVDRPSLWRSAVWGLLLGLIVLVRPVNALVLLAIPVLLGTETRRFLHAWLARPWYLIAAGAMAASMVAIQPVLWHAQVGAWVAYGYKGEGFHWGRPALFQVLFGVRRGLFVWTPALIPAALGVLFLWRHDRHRAVAAAVYWVALTYVVASWWIWYYGSGFGARVFVEHYVVLVLPLALMLQRAQRRILRWSLAFLFAATALHLAQFWQYNHDVLDRECMDREKYAYTFLRFGKAYQGRLGGKYVVPPYHPNGLEPLVHAQWDAEQWVPYWSGRVIPFQHAFSPGHVVACGPGQEFGITFEMPANEIPEGRALYLALGFERFLFEANGTEGVLGVVAAEAPNGRFRQYESFVMEPVPPAHTGRWKHIEYRIALQPLQRGDRVKFYFWDRSEQARFLLDDLDMTVLAVRPY